MKLWIDDANIDVIKRFVDLGICEGVTTNPQWIANDTSNKSFKQIVKDICEVCPGPVSAEVVAPTVEGMVKQAEELRQIADNVVIKVPMTEEGVKVLSECKKRGIPTNATLIFSANQALLAAKTGATYVSPFIGRLYQAGLDGMQLVKEIIEMFKHYDEIKTKVIVASYREPREISEAARLGADIATIKPSFIEDMWKSPFTAIGLEQFNSAWKKVQEAGKDDLTPIS